MMFSQSISDYRQSDTKWFTAPASVVTVQLVRPPIQTDIVRLLSVIQTLRCQYPGNADLQCAQPPYPPRT